VVEPAIKLWPLLAALPLCGCLVGPTYNKPAAPIAVAYKELAGWKPAAPADTIDRGAWWSVYHDPLLDKLESEIDISNQTLAASYAAWRQSQALVREAQSQLYPSLGATASSTRSASGGGGGSSSRFGSGGSTLTSASLEAAASWTLDVWGSIRRTVESDVAGAQASEADVANARLSAQGAVASDYFDLRASDALYKLLADTAAEYQRSLQITQNQYDAGIAARSDVITAQVQVETTQAEMINVGVARAQYEHAIAVLTGHPPADLTIAAGDLMQDVPVVPASVPSSLLERRPDIAAAERAMQQQNALIGVAIANYYPDISLSALYGYSGSPVGSLIALGNRVWSIGASATESIFNGGLTSAEVAAARATYDEAVATYRQTVLTAFQQVEDALSTLRILQLQSAAEDRAVADARRAVAIAINEYQAGTQAYTTVVTAQNTALANQQAALTVQQNRLLASVALIEALGGGWQAADLHRDQAALSP
jgi:NodT family efflux transporter outer membrane factor (OMF) lipoprotein